MADYIVTGGLGFIGNELVRRLGKLGEVCVLDTGLRRAPKIDDLRDVAIYSIDVTDRAATLQAIADAAPEVVFHLAGIHFIPECNAVPDQTLRVNVEGTLNVLDACAQSGVKHLIFASSGAVYADSLHRLSERSLVAPVDIYGWSKCFAEELCRSGRGPGKMAITVARLFNTYGPRETIRHLIPEILEQIRFGDVIYLGNTGSRRDYIYVEDCVAALVRLSQTSASRGRTINIATGRAFSGAELVQILGELLNREFRIVIDQDRVRRADKQVQLADISLLEQMLSWTPEIALRAGLNELLRFEGLIGSQGPVSAPS